MKKALILIAPLGLGFAAIASAQSLREEQQALVIAKKQAETARQRSAQLKRDAATARQDAERARRQAAAMAASIHQRASIGTKRRSGGPARRRPRNPAKPPRARRADASMPAIHQPMGCCASKWPSSWAGLVVRGMGNGASA